VKARMHHAIIKGSIYHTYPLTVLRLAFTVALPTSGAASAAAASPLAVLQQALRCCLCGRVRRTDASAQRRSHTGIRVLASPLYSLMKAVGVGLVVAPF